MSFKEFLTKETSENLNEDIVDLFIKLEDGYMKVGSKSVIDETNEIKISYGNHKCTLITDESSYETRSVKGDVGTILNMLIQQFYIDGVVKTKQHKPNK